MRALKARRPEVLYFNGFFDPRFSIFPQLLWRVRFWGPTTRLLAPRGEFGEGALSRRSAKKRAFIALYRALRLHRGLYWHASSEVEAGDIRRLWGGDARIVIRQNETQLPVSALEPEPVGETLRAVFLGRLVEHKGLHIALAALADVPVPVELDVYGPEEDPAYVERCKTIATALPDTIRVRFHGSVDPDHSRAALEGHELLLMPTAGENFGHVIAEALSVSCAVMCTTRTPWTETLESGGGWALDRSQSAWEDALRRYAELSTGERDASRTRAGEAYAEWRARPTQPHVLELVRSEIIAEAGSR
ncbi:glycosyltransferase [Leifsonia sp. NPDC080035]|uniref:Glycosyltransferase n=1 Tax=Leifsonia sp. NPDC080035 TaxID=3143936 RepID=A0AAU7GJW7_9MICO